MKSRNSLKLSQDEFGRASVLGTPFFTLAGGIIKINDDIYDLTPEIYSALSSTWYTGETMKKDSDVLLTNIFVNDLGYTGDGDKSTKRKKTFKIFAQKDAEIESRSVDEEVSDDLEGQKVNIFIPSETTDEYKKHNSY